jgi:hypothetical protein
VEDDLIRLTRTGGHWHFIDIHTSHRYRRRPTLDWDRRHALAQSHHTGGGLEASLVRYVEDRVILIRSAANFIRSAASVHWRAQSIGQPSMHLGIEPFLAGLIEASWSMHLLLADAGHVFGSRSDPDSLLILSISVLLVESVVRVSKSMKLQKQHKPSPHPHPHKLIANSNNVHYFPFLVTVVLA